MGKMIYLDHAATTPVDPEVLRKMIPYFTEHFGNPSSAHPCGRHTAKVVSDARRDLSRMIGCSDSEIVFTAGASESNNLAIKGVAECYEEKRHFITSSFEHKASLNAMRRIEEWGHEVTYVDPRPDGIIDPRDVEEAMRPGETVLVSIMHVNNEIGTIQPIDDIGEICHRYGALFHTDATQSFCKLPLSCSENYDLISFSAHKFYGPKGVGGLYVNEGIELSCQIDGGSQESGLRAGTTNVPGIVGMVEAAKKMQPHIEDNLKKLKHLERVFLDAVRSNIPMSYVQGNANMKAPWIQNICFFEVDGATLRDLLGREGICVSRSSACATSGEPSHVLESIGLHEQLHPGAIRFSFGAHTTEAELLEAAKTTENLVRRLRGGRVRVG